MFWYGVIFVNRKILCLILMVCVAAAAAFAGCTVQTQDTAAADNTHAKVSQMSMPFDPKTASVSEKASVLYQFTVDLRSENGFYNRKGVPDVYQLR